MADYDLLIKNGTIIDGLRMPAYRGDIGIRSGCRRRRAIAIPL
jgi:N-acyl-D-aspartate/D-glutamate deacylase